MSGARPALPAALLLLPSAALAVTAPMPLVARADALLPVLAGSAAPDTAFTPAFLAQIPAERMRTIFADLRQQLGRPLRVERVEPEKPRSGRFRVAYERGAADLELVVEEQSPHRISWFRITGSLAAAASLDEVAAAVAALPGTASLLVARIGQGQVVPLAAHEPDAPLAVGSAFKLVVLAELVRAIRAGEHRWNEVVPLGATSLPSGVSQDWPDGVPVTLHTLATLMIARSDNRAADTLIGLLGRDRIEGMQAGLGFAQSLNHPFLTTAEAFKLKAGAGLVEKWLAADEAGRRLLLAGEVARFPLASIDVARLNDRPNHIDSVEWFASAADLARAMAWLDRSGSAEAAAILAVNPGIAPAQASRFASVGFKGGSEIGVVNLTLLLRTRSGGRYAVAGTWNDAKAAVDEARFASLIARAAELVER